MTNRTNKTYRTNAGRGAVRDEFWGGAAAPPCRGGGSAGASPKNEASPDAVEKRLKKAFDNAGGIA
jgi:hypothetical protein